MIYAGADIDITLIPDIVSFNCQYEWAKSVHTRPGLDIQHLEKLGDKKAQTWREKP